MRWTGEDAFVLEGTRFRLGYPLAKLDLLRDDELPILKPKGLIDQYVELMSELQPRNIFEIGVAKGGSTAFLATLADPRKYVAVDLWDHTTRSFTDWLEASGLSERVRPFFGIDQADTEALRAIATSEFAGQALDLVIDDASHLVDPTRTSLNVLFPLLRPGGLYVVEDWDGLHQIDKELQNKLDADPGWHVRMEQYLSEEPDKLSNVEAPLTQLVFEIILAAAYTDGIEDIRITTGLLTFRRGDAQLANHGWQVNRSYPLWGRSLLDQL
jgi:cephalosporin hydroxylase